MAICEKKNRFGEDGYLTIVSISTNKRPGLKTGQG